MTVVRKIKMYFNNGSSAVLTVVGGDELGWQRAVRESVARHSAIKWHVA